MTMLGFYPNFPQNIHRVETFSTSIANKKLQQTLVETLFKLNREKPSLEEVAAPSIPGCKVVFEVGVADGNDFNFLDAEERERLIGAINRKPFQVMDFLCVIRYQNRQEERKTRMMFDFYMLRMMFGDSLMEIQVFHEKGARHASPDDLVRLVVNRVNAAFSKRVLKPSEGS
jgi:hypothetical protein